MNDNTVKQITVETAPSSISAEDIKQMYPNGISDEWIGRNMSVTAATISMAELSAFEK